ncbi:thiamine phosphate synthase [Alkalibaculum sp. M08DMB]|uniref:Thiamine-phosphate synthase n=1 Tax=Alkalibaculum sporogenes TaxID=2655001 RepID=A0A6A7KBW8_9FIRM|nr:thiamine phosphate synthase [Alkalibaculum sporogenes]MPW26677.1 thiamine phosphate synthase [Alkalibaculum sporogenes]
MNYNLYLITDKKSLGDKDLINTIELAIKGGVTMIQLREKSISTKDYIQLALKVKKVTDYYDIPLIINDRVDVAMAVCAKGVHLGLDDMPIPLARKILDPDMVIGASACSVEEARSFEQQGADYLGVGAVFPTFTKSNTDQVTISNLELICQSIEIPVVAIGGIHNENVDQLQMTGISGIAVASGILSKKDIVSAARILSNSFPTL